FRSRPPPGAALRLRPAVRACVPRRLTRPGREWRGARGNGCVTIARSLPHPGIAGGEGPLHPVSQVSERTTGVDIDVHGTVAEGFERVGEAFARNFTALGERGAALAVYRDGRRVVDLWAGTKDVDGTDPWRRGTAQVVRPATKGVAAAVLLRLHERGALDRDAPVGHYWPEFEAHGKEGVLVRHVLSHRAGLPVLNAPLTPREAYDPLRAAEALAAQTPVWEPGTDHGYHALTYGWLVDALIRRVTGRGTGEWIASRSEEHT